MQFPLSNNMGHSNIQADKGSEISSFIVCSFLGLWGGGVGLEVYFSLSYSYRNVTTVAAIQGKPQRDCTGCPKSNIQLAIPRTASRQRIPKPLHKIFQRLIDSWFI